MSVGMPASTNATPASPRGHRTSDGRPGTRPPYPACCRSLGTRNSWWQAWQS